MLCHTCSLSRYYLSILFFFWFSTKTEFCNCSLTSKQLFDFILKLFYFQFIYACILVELYYLSYSDRELGWIVTRQQYRDNYVQACRSRGEVPARETFRRRRWRRSRVSEASLVVDDAPPSCTLVISHSEKTPQTTQTDRQTDTTHYARAPLLVVRFTRCVREHLLDASAAAHSDRCAPLLDRLLTLSLHCIILLPTLCQ